MELLNDILASAVNYFLIYTSIAIGLYCLYWLFNSSKKKKALKTNFLLPVFKATNLSIGEQYPQIDKIIDKKYGIDAYISFPPGLSLEDFVKRQEKFEHFLDAQLTLSYEKKRILMEIYYNFK